MSMQFCHLEHSRRLWLWCLLMLVVVAFALYPAAALAQDTPAQPGPDVPRAAPSKAATGHDRSGSAGAGDVSAAAAPSAAQLKQIDAMQPFQPAVRASRPNLDGFGYGVATIPFAWVDISGAGVEVVTWTSKDDGFAGPFPVGFAFPFYTQEWTQFYVNSNGFLTFEGGSTSLDNSCPVPSADEPNNLIALLWDDLDLNISGRVYYQTFAACPLGSGQCLVVAYHDAAHYGQAAGSAGTWEAILYASGEIVLQFLDAGEEAGQNSTTGIENDDFAADFGLSYACDQAASLTDSLALRFAIQPNVKLTPAALTAAVCNTASQQHRLLATNHTGAAGNFALSYSAPAGIAVQGPGTIALGVDASQPVSVTVTPNLCPAPATAVSVTVSITGNGYGATSVILQEVAEGESWQQAPVEPDDGRMDNVLAAYSGALWSITGYDSIGDNATVRSFNPATGVWTSIADSAPPFGVNYARSGCQHGDKVYVYGDTTTEGFTGLWSYNMAANTWQQETPDGAAPPAGIWAPAWAKDAETSRCYLTGGASSSGGGDLTSVFVYDPAANAWLTPLPGFTTPRDFHAAFVWRKPEVNQKYLCVAGGTTAGLGATDSTQCYDFATGAWNAENADLPALPGGWFGMGYAMRTRNNAPQLWLIGGSLDQGIDGRAYFYDAGLGAWLYGGMLATDPVYRTSAVTLDNDIYQVGGSVSGFSNTGNANKLVDCPYCPGLRLQPSLLEAGGCNNAPQAHRFGVWNDTAAAVNAAISYAAAPGVTLSGPAASGPVPAGGRAIFDVELAAAICPDADVTVTATVTAQAAGHQAVAEIEKYIANGPDWAAIASEPDDGRHDHVLAAYEGKIWAIGGSADVGAALPVRTYDPAVNAWSSVAGSAPAWGESLPRSGCQVNSRVYMYGDTFAYTGLVYYDMAANQWVQVAGAANPPPLDAIWAPAWVYDPEANLCYLTGGGDDGEIGAGNLATVYAYNPATNAWSTLPPFSTPRNWHAAFVTRRPTDNHKLLCVAGGSDAELNDLDSTQCYDFTTGAWNQENADLGRLPGVWWGMGYTQRSVGAVAQLWIMAGVNAWGDSDEAIFFDFMRGEWRYSGYLATGYVFRGAAVALADVLYYAGGLAYIDEIDDYWSTGAADRSVDCPACVGLYLEPAQLAVAGCAALSQTHTFAIWNLTGATANVAMSYQPGAGIAATGPATLTAHHGAVTPVSFVATPLLCPAAGAQLNVTVGAAGNGYEDTAALRTTITDEAVWIDRAPANRGHYGAANAVLDDKLYVYGGRLIYAARQSRARATAEPAQSVDLRESDCQVYDVATDRWGACPVPPVYHGLGAGASAGQSIYLIGGLDDQDGVSVAMERLAGGVWTAVAPLPAPRYWGAAAASGGMVYYSGGYNGDDEPTATFWQYDAAADAWTALANLPEPMAEHALVVHGGSIYLFPSNSSDIWRYTIATNTWRVVEPLTPAPSLWDFLAVATEEHIFRIGGYDYLTDEAISQVWGYSVAEERFEEFPALLRAHDQPVGGLLNGMVHAGLGANWEQMGDMPTDLERLLICPECEATPTIYLPMIAK
jgi:N-acetylneuraminic acid mutarotase